MTLLCNKPNGVQVAMSAEEETEHLAHLERAAAAKQVRIAAAAQRAVDQLSGNTKLINLGLTQAEATALTGYIPPAA